MGVCAVAAHKARKRGSRVPRHHGELRQVATALLACVVFGFLSENEMLEIEREEGEAPSCLHALRGRERK